MDNLGLFIDENGNIYSNLSSNIYQQDLSEKGYKLVSNPIDYSNSPWAEQIIKEMEEGFLNS